MIVTLDPAGNQGMLDTSRRQEGGSRVDEIEDIGREV
jgi:hypothetical protein